MPPRGGCLLLRVENGFPGAGYCPFPFETVILNGPPKARCIDVRKPRTSRSQREPLEGRKEAQQILGLSGHSRARQICYWNGPPSSLRASVIKGPFGTRPRAKYAKQIFLLMSYIGQAKSICSAYFECNSSLAHRGVLRLRLRASILAAQDDGFEVENRLCLANIYL